MNTVPPHRDVLELLGIVAKYVSTDPAEMPSRFVIELAQHWKGRGGLLAGKPRHSDRYLDNLLRERGTPIRSLTPKLAGRTQIRAGEAYDLVHLFLTHWDYVGALHGGDPASEERYTPLLLPGEVEQVCAYVADRMAEASSDGRSASEAAARAIPGQDTYDLVAAEFRDAVAFFQIGAGQSLIVPPQQDPLVGFRDIMTRLWEIDSADGGGRLLIWTLDLGRRDFDDAESRVRFLNAQALVTRFKAIKELHEPRAEERWNWLLSRAVVVLHDTRSFRPQIAWLPSFDPNHVLFSAIPPLWAESQEFQILYGTERLRKTNYSIFLKRAPQNAAGRTDRPRYQLNYFGHAVLNLDDKGDAEPRARTLELKPPGRSYVEALGTVCQAATRTLNMGTGNIPAQLSVDGMKIDSDGAMEKLQHHGFQVLRLDEFIKF
jgi:hypothetical protein